MINVSYNNVKCELENNTALNAVLPLWGYTGDKLFAVAINQVFVSRTEYAQTQLKNGDEIDVVEPISGG